jgi:protocatechuate 3,4-dioxygenase beta subunit
LLLQTAGSQRTVERSASIEGIVVRTGTNDPVAGAIVELTGIAPRSVEGSSSAAPGVISVSVLESASDGRVLSYTTTTGGDGKFEIRNVRGGTDYQVVASHIPDYVPAQYGQRIPAVPGHAITLAPGQQFRDARIELTPSASISGLVVDSRGQPIRNVVVELRRPWYLEGWRLLSEWNQLIPRVQGVGKTNRAGTQATNSRGEFRFSGLAPAQYYLRTRFTDEESEPAINLRAGANITGVKIVASESRDRNIRGVILDTSGAAVRSAQIAVLRKSVPLYGDLRMDSQGVESDDKGQFTLTVPGSGKYLLVAAAAGNRTVLRARKEIEVQGSDLQNVRLQLVAPFEIRGRVTYEGNAPAVDSGTALGSLTLYPTAVGLTGINAPLPTANGAFTLRGVTIGDYRVEVQPILVTPPSPFVPSTMERLYVKTIRLNGRDILNGGLNLESAPNGTLEVVISTNGGTVGGRVLDSSGKPLPNIKTVVVPNASRRLRGDLYKYVSTDDTGRFQLSGLAPGDYRVFAWERVEEGAWQDPQFLRLFENEGSPVRVEEGSRVTVETRLIPAWN